LALLRPDGLYTRVFEKWGLGNMSAWVRAPSSCTAGFSFAIVQQSSRGLIGSFRFGQPRHGPPGFGGLANLLLRRPCPDLTFLWGAMLKLRETRTRLIQLVLALGLYFSVFAASYAFWNLSPA